MLPKEIGLWFILFPFRKFISYLPMKLNYSLAHLSSLFFYLFFKKRRKGITEEVEKLFGRRFDKEEINRIVKKSFSIFLKRQVENLLFGNLTRNKLNHMTTLHGMDHLNKALQAGKGVILLLSHFGSFLLPLPVLGYKGYKVIQVAGRTVTEKHRPINEKVLELRKKEADKLPFQIVQTDENLRLIVKSLRNNGIIVIAFDGRAGNRWVPVKILKRTAHFSPGPFNLAIKTGAIILPTFVVRGKDNKHRIIFEPEMKLDRTDDKEGTLNINTIKYAKIFERYLLRYPCHFAMTLYSIREEAYRGLNRPLFID